MVEHVVYVKDPENNNLLNHNYFLELNI